MKNNKTLKSMLLPLLTAASMIFPMAVAFSVSTFASGTTIGTLTITGADSTARYNVYKVLSGNVDGDFLIESGTTFSGADLNIFLEKLKIDTVIGADFSSCTTAYDIASVLSGYADDSEKAVAFADFVVKNSNLVKEVTTNSSSSINLTEDGLYVIQDTTNYAMPCILTPYDASKGLDVAVKHSVPSVTKKVYENSYNQDDGYGTGYNDVADFSIGDKMCFKLIGTLPDNIADYSSYNYVFHDNYNLKNNKGSVSLYNDNFKVYAVQNSETANENNQITGYNININGSGITLKFNNLKSATYTKSGNVITLNKDTKIVIEYFVLFQLSPESIGRNGHTNEVYLEYSANFDGSGTKKTKTDKVIMFTYGIDVNKIDADDNTKELKGSKFALYKIENGQKYYAYLAPDNANYDWDGTSFNLVSCDGYQMLEWVPGEYDENGTFVKKVGEPSGTFSNEPTLTDGLSLSLIYGLDSGTYYLVEKEAPEGYNKLTEPIEFTINADTSNGQNEDADGTELKALEVKVGGTVTSCNPETGKAVINVENKKKSVILPSTGGIGTRIFYIVGGALAVGSGAALVVKKRMGKNNDD